MPSRMRTTITLDDDIAAALERLRKDRNVGFNELVNDVLLRGLDDLPPRREPFRTRSVALGQARVSNVSNVTEAITRAEGDDFK